MTIGEALKEEQKNKNYSNKQMAANIISQATYSKVINNKQSISSELLVQLLFYHDIDIDAFFEKIKLTYKPRNKQTEEKIRKKMFASGNSGNVEQMKAYSSKINKLKIPLSVKLNDQLVIAYLSKNLDQLDNSIKNNIIQIIQNNSNWIKDPASLRLFATSLIILPDEMIENEMKLFFIKLNRFTNLSEKMKERYAMVCDNYLHWKFDNKMGVNNNVKNALVYLKNLPDIPHFVIYRISGEYYSEIFQNKFEDAKKIKKMLLRLNCKTGVMNWPL